jgi:hypothetical protein
MTEWQVMVHVIQGRDLPDAEINPYVCIQIDEPKRSTGVQKSSNSPFFGEVTRAMSRVHLIVQFLTFDITLPAASIMEKMVDFKVHHASQFTDTKPIGVCQRSTTRKISCSNGNGRK